MFAQLGIPTYGIRACAKVRDNREELSKVAQELLIINIIAEFAVLVVQYWSLKNEVRDSFKQIHYIKIAIALVLGSMASLWVKLLGLGNFITLVISAVLFFGAYALVLLAFKEEMVIEILETFKLKKRGEVEK